MDGIPEYGHDAIFHVSRFMTLNNVWSSPVNYSMTESGTLVNAFYPWLTIYPLHIFHILTGNIVTAYNLYISLLTVITIFISYYSVKTITENIPASFCFAVIYTFSSYRFMDIYLRAAMGEAVSMAFLPLVICGIYQIFYKDNSKWKMLCVGMTLIAYSHILTLYLTSIIILPIILASLFFVNEKGKRLIAFVKATLVSVILSAASLIPIVYYSLRNDLTHPDGNATLFLANLRSVGTYIKNSFTNSVTPYSYGTVMLFVMIINFIVLFVLRKKIDPFVATLIIISCFFFLTITSIIPWDELNNISFLRIIQFPWRLSNYTTLFSAVAFAMLLSDIKSRKILMGISGIIALASSVIFIFSTVKIGQADTFFILTDDFVKNYMKVDSRDYTPVSFYEYREANDFAQVEVLRNGEPLIPTVCNGGNALYFYFPDSVIGETIELPVCFYSSTFILVNGIEKDITMSERGTVTFVSDSEGDTEVIVINEYGPETYISRVISFIAMILFIFEPVIRNQFHRSKEKSLQK